MYAFKDYLTKFTKLKGTNTGTGHETKIDAIRILMIF